MNHDPLVRQKQLKYCYENTDDGVYHELNKLVNEIDSIDIKCRLALIDITLPALRQLSKNQEQLFLKNFIALVKMDSKISVFEWVLQKIIYINVNNNYRPQQLKEKHYSSLGRLKSECSIVFSLLIYTDLDNNVSPYDIFSKLKSGLKIDIVLVNKNKINLKIFDSALNKLKQLKPLLKPQFLKACALAINGDSKITPKQLELYRAISDILDCPMPPIIKY